ncbi:MAG: hydroxypyruvate isomerase, partial [Chloroflexus aggregans]
MIRFALNVSLTMRDTPWLDRFDTAARLGFNAVEFWWPDGVDLTAIHHRLRDTGLQPVLVNLPAGNLAQGERGLLNHPTRQAE